MERDVWVQSVPIADDPLCFGSENHDYQRRGLCKRRLKVFANTRGERLSNSILVHGLAANNFSQGVIGAPNQFGSRFFKEFSCSCPCPNPESNSASSSGEATRRVIDSLFYRRTRPT